MAVCYTLRVFVGPIGDRPAFLPDLRKVAPTERIAPVAPTGEVIDQRTPKEPMIPEIPHITGMTREQVAEALNNGDGHINILA